MLSLTGPTYGGRGATATAVATVASARVRRTCRTESEVQVESTKVLKYTSALHCTALLHFRTALGSAESAVQCSAVRCFIDLTRQPVTEELFFFFPIL